MKMAKQKCTCPDCKGNCSRRRNVEKCPTCGRDKLEHRQCYNCDAPTAFISQTGSEQPRVVPMFKRALPRLPIGDDIDDEYIVPDEHIRAKPKAVYKAIMLGYHPVWSDEEILAQMKRYAGQSNWKRIQGYRRGKPSSFMADELEVEVSDDD